VKTITIRDIAKRAGVVPSTVSVVLNGKAKEMRISDRLANQIRVIAEEMGYYPNQTAVSLRTGKTKMLGLIIEDISNIFFASLAKIIEDEADSIGYKVVYCSTENNDDKGCELIKMLSLRQIDGLLITPTNGMTLEISKLLEKKKPVVLMDRYFPYLNAPCVLSDNFTGIKDGVEHLLHKGHNKIAFVTVDLDQIQMHERERAYFETLQSHNIETKNNWTLKLPYKCKPAEAIHKITSFISSISGLQAIIFATNYLGIYGLDSIRQLGISIPSDLAVICFDDHDIFRLHTPGITIIEQPIKEIAMNSIQLLMKQFENKELAVNELQVFKKPKLVIRAST
jgi:LacI family transcriptional regulator